jgi:hypothetical protein
MDLEDGQPFVTDVESHEGQFHLLGVEIAAPASFSTSGRLSAEDLETRLGDREELGIGEDEDWNPPKVLIGNWILGDEILE